MMQALIARIAITALVAGLCAATGCVTGYWYAMAKAEEARTEAVMAATDESRARLLDSLKDANVRARAHVERVEALRRELRERERAVERYAESDAGAEICLDPDGVDAWNAL